MKIRMLRNVRYECRHYPVGEPLEVGKDCTEETAEHALSHETAELLEGDPVETGGTLSTENTPTAAKAGGKKKK